MKQANCIRAGSDPRAPAAGPTSASISNTIHNLDLERCKHATREIERVSSAHKYVQVDSWLTVGQQKNFERWQLTAVTSFEPDDWRRLFGEVGYTGDSYWTLTE